MSGEVWQQIYDRLAALIARRNSTTLIFVNTRRMAERVTRQLSDRIGEEHITAHHGSLAKEARFDAEQRLKRGELRALVAHRLPRTRTSYIRDVDLARRLEFPARRSLLPAARRAAPDHALGGTAQGPRAVPADRATNSCRTRRAAAGCVQPRRTRPAAAFPSPTDVLAQQIVAEVLDTGDGRRRGCSATACARRMALPRTLTRRGVSTRSSCMLGRRLQHAPRPAERRPCSTSDAVGRKLRATARRAPARRSPRGGAISRTPPTTRSSSNPAGPARRHGEPGLSPSRAVAGDVFQLGNSAYRILRVEARHRPRRGRAKASPPSIPYLAGRSAGPQRRAVLRRGAAARGKSRRAWGMPTARRCAGSPMSCNSIRPRRSRSPIISAQHTGHWARCPRRPRSSSNASSTMPETCTWCCIPPSAAA